MICGEFLKMVNKGNCVFQQGHFDKAQEYYHEALSVEATCSEALYNLGLVHMKLGQYQESLECFQQTLYQGCTGVGGKWMCVHVCLCVQPYTLQ